MERYEVNWEGELSIRQVIGALPDIPVDEQDELIHWDQIITGGVRWRWESMTTDMGSVSLAFPGVIFRVEITNVEDDARRVQYHRDGLFYEAAERREMPAFDPGRLAFEAPRDHGVLSLDTPIAQRPTLRDALQFLVEEAERDLVELHRSWSSPRAAASQ